MFSFCEREADKFPLHETTDSRSRPDNPKKPQATEKCRWPGKKRPRPSKLWGAVLRNRTLQKKASGLPESARGQVGCGTSCATHQPLVEAPLFWTTSSQTFFKPRAQARRLVAPAGRNTHRSHPAFVCHLTQDRALGNSILQSHESQLTA